MIDDSKKDKIIERILQSPEFKEAPKYLDLLRFLVKKSVTRKPVKEKTIAAELFGKGSGFDPHHDPIIRVYMSHLRKKLAHYYDTSGKEDPVRLEIPKGHYHIDFVLSKGIRSIQLQKTMRFLILLSVFGIVILIGSIAYLSLRNHASYTTSQSDYTNNPIWAEFFQKDQPTLIVLGDFLFLYEWDQNEKRRIHVRDPRINSTEELDAWISQKPDLKGKVHQLEFTYLRPSGPWCLLKLSPILYASRNKTSLKLASDLTWADLENNNILFIGSYKTLYILNRLFSNLYFRYRLAPFDLVQLDDRAGIVHTYHASPTDGGYYQIDYPLISKIPGPRNNAVLIIAGFDEMGIMQAVEKIIDPSLPKLLRNNYLRGGMNHPLFFQLLIQTEGFKRTGFKSEIRFFRTLPPVFNRVRNQDDQAQNPGDGEERRMEKTTP